MDCFTIGVLGAVDSGKSTLIEIKSKYNCIFNNMNDNDIYDVDKYIQI